MNASVLQIRGLTKAFPGVLALDGVDFDLRPGEIHAVVGKNGAGKSTLISIISGETAPDLGSFVFEGATLQAHELASLPVATVYQETAVFPNLTVAENIFAGNQPINAWGNVDTREANERAQRLLDQFGASIQATDLVTNLSVVEQKVVAIIRAFEKKSRILILDEPTAVLSITETKRLFELLEQTRAADLSIIYISHRLDEIFEIADRVTVIRNGRIAHTGEVSKIDIRRLITEIVGPEIASKSTETAFENVGNKGTSDETPEFETRSLTHAGGRFTEVSLSIRQGEIVGLAGLIGAGKSEFAKAIFGIESFKSGRMFLDGIARQPGSVSEAIRLGIIYVTEDRKHDGLFGDMTIAANVCIPVLDHLANGFGLISADAMTEHAKSVLSRYKVKASGVDQIVATLSGGNQQKVLLARWLQLAPRLLMVDEPTIGVDVSAREEIYRLLHRIASAGTAILFISCDLKELMQNADRIVTLHKGRTTGSFPAAEVTEQELLEAVSGLTRHSEVDGDNRSNQ